jgi:DNA-directed RNA polymerase II subunit RPB1
MSINSKYYSEDIKNVQRITFNILGNDEVKKYSSVRKDPFGINIAESYDNYEPKKGGLVDLRLGTCDIYLPCTTCGLNSNDCPGHFGHTELSEYVYHFGFLETIVVNLKKVCHRCSNLLFDKTDINLQTFLNKNNKMRAKETKEIVKNNKFCPHCGTPVPKIKQEVKEASASIKIIIEKEISESIVDEKGITTDDKRTIKEELSPRRCYNIFKNVSNNDCILLGFDPDVSRPEDMILTRFPIPPVAIRPTAKIDFMSSSTMEDSLTLKIADIISTNIKVRDQMNRDSANVKDMNTLLQYHIATYFDNNSKLPTSEFKSGGKPTKSIADRLKAKEGRVRFNLMGKRVDFSARSVITSDPNINIDEVGVPLKVAMELTIPEEVTPKNIKYLTKLVKNGRDVYPGANFVFRTTFINGKPVNQKIDLKYRKKDIKLSYGDVVERHIINGDYVLFNRQPTLHKPSMMGHKIHVLNRDDANTFRMNVSVAGPYNADFDGDEMNIHLAQSIQARNELERLANVKYQIIGAKNSSPIIGCVQDSISGAFLLSQDNDIDYDLASLLLCTTSSKTKMNLIKDKVITGNELFSHIIPNGINSIKKKGDNTFFQIKNGNLLKGILDKSQLSTSKNSIIHYIWDKYGPQETQDFINDTQRIIINYLMERGLTIGFKDTIINDALNDKVNEYVRSKVLSIKYNITQYENNKEELDLDMIESSLQNELGPVNANLGKLLMDSVEHDNNFYTLIGSKAKGKPVNFAQIAGCMGQMTLEGKRMKKKINGRTLPIFYQNDDTASSRGFIPSNLVDGLKGHEFFFNATSGREGLIDTAIKTSETGYIQRKLIKALEDLYVRYDGTIRTIDNTVVQYLYGESGINQVKQTEVKIKTIEMNNKQVIEQYVFTKEQLSKLESKFKKKLSSFNDNIKHQMIQFRDDLRKIYTKSKFNYKIIEDMFMLPINLYRLAQEYSNNKESFGIDPEYIITRINDLLEDYNERLLVLMNKNSQLLKKDEEGFKYLLKIALYEYISPKKCLIEYGLTKGEFDNMMNEMELSFSKAVVEPGEMVGIVAAQSIGEPTSQMTLDTKHFAGVASGGSSNMGVSRIKEILGYSKKIKTPQTTIYFDNSIHTDKKKVNIITSSLKHLTIGELISSAEIIYDTNMNDNLHKELEKDQVKNPFFINNKKVELDTLPFVIRLRMDIEKLLDKETSLLDIKTKFITYWYKNFSDSKTIKKQYKNLISNIDSLAILSNNRDMIHIRFRMLDFNYSDLTIFLKTIVLDVVTLKGIDDINGINMFQDMYVQFDDEGNKKIEKEWVVVTEGINMNELLTIRNIDTSRTKLNDIMHVYHRYGIEAARQTILNELNLTFSTGGGGDINNAHMSLLVDLMTHLGEVISIARHGLIKIDSEPMAKASFEQTMDHFINAAIYNEDDNIKSVSSRIILGRVINGGTGSFDIVIDTKKLINSEYIEDETGGRTDFIKLGKDDLFSDIINNELVDLNFMTPN